MVHRNGLRLQRLVNALLDFSRIEAGRTQASYDPTDLAAFTAELASSFRSAMERAGLQFAIDCPPFPEPVYVDREMWEKVVLNLLSNAFKYTLEGSVAVNSSNESGLLRGCMVSDTGVGIPEEELPRLFERFHRVEGDARQDERGNWNRSGSGAGTGQAARRFGKITSTVGQGSTFTVSIPSEPPIYRRNALGAAQSLSLDRITRGRICRAGDALASAPNPEPTVDSDAGSELPARSAAASCLPMTTPICASTSVACSNRNMK